MKIFFILVIGLSLCLSHANAQSKDMETTEQTFVQPFEQGEKLPEQFSQFFIGQAYLSPVSNSKTLGTHISNVTFSPSCRNNWHSHSGGQLLIATAGTGIYKEKGKPARLLKAGDVVEINPDIEHWHGAYPGKWFAHLAIECNLSTNKNTWGKAVEDKEYMATAAEATNHEEKHLSSDKDDAQTADTVFANIFNSFVLTDVAKSVKLDDRNRSMIILASCIAQNTVSQFRKTIGTALSSNVSPLQIKEIVYQSAAYCGGARTNDFLTAVNDEFSARGISLPSSNEPSKPTTDRLEKGLELQKSIFGERIEKMRQTSPEDLKHIQDFLSANCFGDYQTRTTLDSQTRELLTFAMLASMGGCESQLKGHIQGNLNVGNNREKLIASITHLLPYIGYPRTLNAINCINEVAH